MTATPEFIGILHVGELRLFLRPSPKAEGYCTNAAKPIPVRYGQRPLFAGSLANTTELRLLKDQARKRIALTSERMKLDAK
jgi:hypothetical protein